MGPSRLLSPLVLQDGHFRLCIDAGHRLDPRDGRCTGTGVHIRYEDDKRLRGHRNLPQCGTHPDAQGV